MQLPYAVDQALDNVLLGLLAHRLRAHGHYHRVLGSQLGHHAQAMVTVHQVLFQMIGIRSGELA